MFLQSPSAKYFDTIHIYDFWICIYKSTYSSCSCASVADALQQEYLYSRTGCFMWGDGGIEKNCSKAKNCIKEGEKVPASALLPLAQDMYSGLIGPLKVCRRGALRSSGSRKDVKREFALLFLVFDENQSWYLEENVERFSKGNHKEINLLDEKFVESNKMHGNVGVDSATSLSREPDLLWMSSSFPIISGTDRTKLSVLNIAAHLQPSSLICSEGWSLWLSL